MRIDAALETILVSMDLSSRASFLMRCLATRDINFLFTACDKAFLLLNLFLFSKSTPCGS
jgi:hypothetical protein